MSLSDPPKWADRLLEWLCPASLLEEVQGDLHEAFHWRLKQRGPFLARWLFVMEAIRMSQPQTLQPIRMIKNYLLMHKNYLKTGWRFLKKHSLFSALNILGLAIGISFCWLAYLYANDEVSYDKHLHDHEKLFRIVIDYNPGPTTHYIGGSSHAMSVQFGDRIPEIDQVIRIKSGGGMIRQEAGVIRQSYLVADPSLIAALELSFVEGAAGAFDQPNDVIISEQLAGKLNLRGKAPGNVLTINNGNEDREFIIRGVYKDIPLNTSIRSHMIIAYAHREATAPSRRLTTWFDINMNTLIKLRDVRSKEQVEAKMTAMHIENEGDEEETFIRLQPISEIHLNPAYGHYNGIARGGNMEMIRLFVGIGLFCLLISMINYSNFNISLYINRAREVALRKVVGARRLGIFSQLITESFLSCFIAGVFALFALILILPFFSNFVGKAYNLSFLLNTQFVVGAVAILVVTALLSGMYPAFVLSRFSIIKSLKGEQRIKSGKWITQTLLAIQFVIASSLIAGVLTMKQQVKYLSNFDTKINYQDVLFLDYIPGSEDEIKQFMTRLDQFPEVTGMAAISGYNGTRTADENLQFDVRHLRIDRDMISLLDIQLVAGRNFNDQLVSDRENGVIVNQAFLKKAGLTDPIGKTIPFKYGEFKNPVVIGVVEDYLFKSAKNVVEPLVIYLSEQYRLQSVYVRLHPNSNVDQEKFEAAWSEFFDPFPLEYRFLEDYYLAAFESENRMIQLVSLGCGVSIFLAAMGLLGIVGLQLSHRMKEISIRKVLGASTSNLYQVFSRKYLLIISIGLTGGLVISYYFIQGWLDNYPFHVEFGKSIIGWTVLCTISVAVTTTMGQVWRVVKANPVTYLRNE